MAAAIARGSALVALPRAGLPVYVSSPFFPGAGFLNIDRTLTHFGFQAINFNALHLFRRCLLVIYGMSMNWITENRIRERSIKEDHEDNSVDGLIGK